MPYTIYYLQDNTFPGGLVRIIGFVHFTTSAHDILSDNE